MTVNEHIKQLLKEKNKNQAELADFLGVRQNTISDWITKGKSPSINYAYRICDFFDISFDYLFTGKDENEKTFYHLTESEREILHLVHPLSDKDRTKVIGIIENYLGNRASVLPDIQPMYLTEEQADKLFRSSAKKPL